MSTEPSKYPLDAQSLLYIKKAKEQLSTCVKAFDDKITELQSILERLEDTGAANFIDNYADKRKLLIATNTLLVEIWNSEINSMSKLLNRSEPLSKLDGMKVAKKLHEINQTYLNNYVGFAGILASFTNIIGTGQEQKDALKSLYDYIEKAFEMPPSATSQLGLAAQAILNIGQEKKI